MAEPMRIGNKFRMLVRKAGQTRCKTFASRKAANDWGKEIEREIDQLRSVGYVQPKGLTYGDLTDRYIKQLYPIKPWGRSKAADLARLKTDIGGALAENLTHEKLLECFLQMNKDGAGGVTISARAGYLVQVLETAKDVWRLNVPVEAARSARSALSKLGLIQKSKHRDRRVTDAELERVIAHVERKATAIHFRAIIWFSVATAMRISETCRLQWSDLNDADKTIRIRDRKHPSEKMGNHQIVPLLENLAGHNAYALAQEQPKKGRRIFPVNSRTVSDYFSEAVQELGIDDLHLHDVRHEAISRLFEAKFRIEQVSLISGHRDWSSLKRYTHPVARDLHPKKAA